MKKYGKKGLMVFGEFLFFLQNIVVLLRSILLLGSNFVSSRAFDNLFHGYCE
jgi:hypothetical protein